MKTTRLYYRDCIYFKIQYNGAVFNRGDVVFGYSTIERLLFVNWVDLKHVMVLSSLPHITNEMGECKRRMISASGKCETKTFPRPQILEQYSGKMYFVDRRYLM